MKKRKYTATKTKDLLEVKKKKTASGAWKIKKKISEYIGKEMKEWKIDERKQKIQLQS